MEKIKNFFNKHGFVAFIALFMLMSIRGCVKNGKINRLEKEKTKLQLNIDSLSGLVMNPNQKKTIEWEYGVSVYNQINDEIFKLNRNEQMMGFQEKVIIKNRTILTDSLSRVKNN